MKKETVRWFVSEESGQGMVEYTLIIMLVAIALIAALKLMEGGLETSFETINSALGEAVS